MPGNLSTRLSDAQMMHLRFLVRLENGTIKRIIKALKETRKEIINILNRNEAFIKTGTDAFQTLTQTQINRLNSIMQEIDDVLTISRLKMTDTLSKELIAFAQAEMKMIISISNAALPISSGAQLSFDEIPLDIVAQMVDTPLGGERFADRLIKNYGDAVARIRASITNSVIQGRTIAQASIEVGAIIGDAIGHRATTLVRTEISRVANQAHLVQFRNNSDKIKVLIWSSALDSKVCPICARLHGKVFKLDTNRQPPAHPNCLVNDTLVSTRDSISAVSKRWFDGEIIILNTASGHEIRCTPNHPIATPFGWVSANLFDKGDAVLIKRPGITNGNNYNVPTRVEDIVESFLDSPQVLSMPVPSTFEHFHGDGIEGEVSIIGADSLLIDEVQSTFSEQRLEDYFNIRDLKSESLNCQSTLALSYSTHRLSFDSEMGISNLSSALSKSHMCPFHSLSFGLTSDMNSAIYESFTDFSSTNHIFLGDSIFGHTPDIEFDYVVDIECNPFSGHVYNLQTQDGWYFANGIITHNCRCVFMVQLKSWQEMGLRKEDIPARFRKALDGRKPQIEMNFNDWLKRQPASIQLEMLGPGRLALFKQGVLSVKDMASDTKIFTLADLKRKNIELLEMVNDLPI